MKFESAPPPAKSPAERIKDYLEQTKEAHEFDVANVELSEEHMSAIVDLIELSEKARHSIRENNWSDDEHKAYEEIRTRIDNVLSSLDVSSDQSEEGMLAAFLKNKLMVVDLIDSRLGK